MKEIKAKETEYNGYLFRSRLEARWAVFFDALGVEYEYEPEGFELPSGKGYLPDFRVTLWGVRGVRDNGPHTLYIEIKPTPKMTQYDADRIYEFVGRDDKKVMGEDGSIFVDYRTFNNYLLVINKLPSEGCSRDADDVGAYDCMNGVDIYPFNYWTIDGDYFAAYPAAHEGKFYLWGDDSNYINADDIPSVEAAYRVARKARFEWGETPTKQEVQRRFAAEMR